MRYLLAPLLLAALIYGGWPYYTYYRLDSAVAAGDARQLGELVDLASVQADQQRSVERRLQRQLPGQDSMSALVRDGARLMTRAASTEVTLEWVGDQLRGGPMRSGEPYPSLVARTRHAFFETPTGFVARIGELGDAPLFVRLKFADWQWRVVGIYPCNS